VWSQLPALPGSGCAAGTIDGVVVLDVDAKLVLAHRRKAQR
jgi:hypothetical protein